MKKSSAQLDLEIATELAAPTPTPEPTPREKLRAFFVEPKAPRVKKPTKAEREKAIELERRTSMFTSGDRAWAIITEAIGNNAKNKDRRQIIGAAQVRIEDGRGDRIRAFMIKASPTYLNGTTRELRHGEVFQDTPEGRSEFKIAADRFWGKESHKK